jgi:tetratricopeptide (TPR) repeat protein
MNLGMFLLYRGLINTGIKLMNRVTLINPTNPYAYQNRAVAYEAIGNFEQSKLDILKVLEIAPESIFSSKWRIRQLILSDKITETKDFLQKMKKRFSDNHELQLGIISLSYALNGEKEESLKIFPNGSPLLFYIFNMVDEAIDYLYKDFENHKNSEYSIYFQLKNSKMYDFLRSDPRFQEILAKHKEIYEENLEKYGDIDI